MAWNDACCFARSSEPPGQSNGLCFRPKWTSRPPDPAFSWISGPKKLDIQQNVPVGTSTAHRRVGGRRGGNASSGGGHHPHPPHACVPLVVRGARLGIHLKKGRAAWPTTSWSSHCLGRRRLVRRVTASPARRPTCRRHRRSRPHSPPHLQRHLAWRMTRGAGRLHLSGRPGRRRLARRVMASTRLHDPENTASALTYLFNHDLLPRTVRKMKTSPPRAISYDVRADLCASFHSQETSWRHRRTT